MENWKPVVGYEHLYLVSDRGNVMRFGARHPLKPLRSKNGYFYVALSREAKVKRVLIHGLVAEAFIGTRPQWNIVNHLDGVKTNNDLGNLEYITYRENSQHAVINHLSRTGVKHPFAKLTPQQAREIKRRLQDGEPKARLSREFGVTSSSIRDIERGLTWATI